MQIEVLQTIAGWLSDGATGFNAIRTTVPRYAGDDPPPAVSVVQAFRDSEAAREQAPQTGQAVLEVTLDPALSQEAAPAVRPFPADGDMAFTVRYLAVPSTDTPLQLRQAALSLRIVSRILASRAINGPTVNQVQLISVSQLRISDVYTPSGDNKLTMVLTGLVRVRDLWTHPI